MRDHSTQKAASQQQNAAAARAQRIQAAQAKLEAAKAARARHVRARAPGNRVCALYCILKCRVPQAGVKRVQGVTPSEVAVPSPLHTAMHDYVVLRPSTGVDGTVTPGLCKRLLAFWQEQEKEAGAARSGISIPMAAEDPDAEFLLEDWDSDDGGVGPGAGSKRRIRGRRCGKRNSFSLGHKT